MSKGDLEITITPDEWTELLRAAKAPEPWADPNAAQKFAAAITSRELDTLPRMAWDRARDAVDELRRVLPEMIRAREQTLERLAERGRSHYRIADTVRADTEALRLLQQALPEPHVFALPRRGKAWHIDAERLLLLYREHVNPKSGMTAKGRAVNFIALALKRMGHGVREPNAIEKALRRRPTWPAEDIES
jgi:hypothetical protein